MEEKKKNTGSIVFIILLIIIILGLVGYILYDKGVFSKKEVQKETTTTTNVETLRFKEARKLLDEYNINYLSVKDYKNSGYYFEYLVSTLDSKNDSCNILMEKDNWYKEGEYLAKDNYVCYTKIKAPSYSYDDLNKMYKKVYNKDLKKESFSLDNMGNCYLDAYYYIKKTDEFIKVNIRGGCTTGPNSPLDIDIITDAKIENNILTITANIEQIKRDDLSITEKGFKIHDEKIELNLYDEEDEEAWERNMLSNTEIIRSETIQSYLDIINKYEITFKVDGSKYTFDNIKKVN